MTSRQLSTAGNASTTSTRTIDVVVSNFVPSEKRAWPISRTHISSSRNGIGGSVKERPTVGKRMAGPYRLRPYKNIAPENSRKTPTLATCGRGFGTEIDYAQLRKIYSS